MRQYIPETVKKLIGKKFKELSLVDDYTAKLLFEDETYVLIDVEGDCCSRSVFYETEYPKECIGAELIDIDAYDRENKDIPEHTPKEAWAKINQSRIEITSEEDSIWSVKIKTSGGTALIRHLNSSNGYYDGMISISDILTEK